MTTARSSLNFAFRGLDRFRAGDALTAERLNVLVDAVNALSAQQMRRRASGSAAALPAETSPVIRWPFEVYDVFEKQGMLSCSVAPGCIMGSGRNPTDVYSFSRTTYLSAPASSSKMGVFIAFPAGASVPVVAESLSVPGKPANVACIMSALSAVMPALYLRSGSQSDDTEAFFAMISVASLEKTRGHWAVDQVLRSDFYFSAGLASKWEYWDLGGGEDEGGGEEGGAA